MKIKIKNTDVLQNKSTRSFLSSNEIFKKEMLTNNKLPELFRVIRNGKQPQK